MARRRLEKQSTSLADGTDEFHVFGLDCLALAVRGGHVGPDEIGQQQLLCVFADGRDRFIALARRRRRVVVARAARRLSQNRGRS